MDTYITMVQGDAAPLRIFSFIRQDGSIADLTTASNVTFNIVRPDTGAQTNSSGNTCTILMPATAGQAQYNWNTTDLPVAGVYRCLLRINYSNGTTETNIVYITVESDTN